MKYTFKPHIRKVGNVSGLQSIETLSSEPMLFSAGWQFAWKNGGRLTREIMQKLFGFAEVIDAINGKNGLWVVIDTRVHMLMAGMWPAIPGWHGDAFPRCDKYAQPDLEAYNSAVKHYICLVASNVDVSLTKFASQEVTVDVNRSAVWKSVDAHMRQKRSLRCLFSHEGDIIEFDQRTLHTAQPCKVPGWRLFFRLSLYHKPPENKIRKQVQVYTDIGAGW